MTSNPFVGPSPLGVHQTIYGRDREIRELFYLLAAERIVWLHSPSGAGKTSLVQSGLIPRLLRDDFLILPTIRVSWQPAIDLPKSNRFALSMLVSLEEHRQHEEKISLEKLACLSMPDYLKTFRIHEEEKCLVLLFDQFEEVLTVDPLAHKARQEFFEQLGELLEDRRLWALFSIREDYLAPLASYAEVLPTRMSHHFRLDLLDLGAAHQAMVATALDGGRRFAVEAATKLVGDLAGVEEPHLACEALDEEVRHVEPVQLQVVCRSLWEKIDAEQQQIGLKDLQKIGNVDRALQDYYADRLQKVARSTEVDERQLRDWFGRQLITEAGLRGQVLRGTRSSGGLPNRAVLPLVDAHLIRKERRRGLVWIELAHDRLVAPVRSDNARWRQENLSLLARCTEAWEQAGRPTDKPRLFLRGEELAGVDRWLEEPGNHANSEEQIYLEICRASVAAENSRRERVRRMQGLGLALGLIIVMVCWRIWQQKLEARREIAREHEAAAGVAYREAVFSQSWKKTLEALSEGDERLPVSLGRLLHPDLQPSSVRPQDSAFKGFRPPKGSRLHGVWLAKSEKGDRVFTVSSRHVIERSLYHLWWLDLVPGSKAARLPISLDEARSFAWDARGQRLAVGDWRGEVTLLQWTEDRWLERQTLKGHGCRVQQGCDILSLRFDNSGRWLAAGDTGDVTLWDIEKDGLRPKALTLAGCMLPEKGDRGDPERSRVMGLSFDPMGERLAVGLEDGRVFLHSLEGGCSELEKDLGLTEISVLSFQQDGWLVAGGAEVRSPTSVKSMAVAPIALWNYGTGETITPPILRREEHGRGIRIVSLAFHPERSDIFASGLDNGQIFLWRRHSARTGWLRRGEASLELLAKLAIHSGAVTGLSFGDRGRELVSVSSDGSLRRVSLRLKRKGGTKGDQVGNPGEGRAEEFDTIDVLTEPSAHQEFLRSILDMESGLTSPLLGETEVASNADFLAGSDAWSWSETVRWSLEGGGQELCRDGMLLPDGLEWLQERRADSWAALCSLAEMCECEMRDDDLIVHSAGTLQKVSGGEEWQAFVDHRLVTKWTWGEAKKIFSSMDIERSECLEEPGDSDNQNKGPSLQRWCDLPKRKGNGAGVFDEFMGRRVVFRQVTLNGQPGFIEVKPRKEVRIEFDWQVELTDPSGEDLFCPACQMQLYYGLADPLVDRRYDSVGAGRGFSKCLANAVMGPGYRGDSGSRVHSFQAPDRPGIYYVTWRLGFDYICRKDADAHRPNISQALAAVRVLGEYEPKLERAKVLDSARVDLEFPSGSLGLNRVAVGASRIAIASFSGKAKAWTVDGAPVWIPGLDSRSHTHRLTDIAWHPDGDRLLTASVDKNAILWGTDGPLEIPHPDRVLSAVFSPTGEQILTACKDGNAYLQTLQGERLATLEGHEADVVSATFSPGGDLIVTASRDQTARIWDSQGREVTVLKHQGWLRAARFSPSGRFVATASEDKQVRVWVSGDLVSGAEGVADRYLQGSHEDAVTALAFSPDEQYLATVSLDGKVRLWDLSEHRWKNRAFSELELVAGLEGHADGIVDLDFSPDGRRIATASHDETVRIWEIDQIERTPIASEEKNNSSASYVLEGHRQPVLAVRFVGNDRVVTVSFDTAKIWSLDGESEGL